MLEAGSHVVLCPVTIDTPAREVMFQANRDFVKLPMKAFSVSKGKTTSPQPEPDCRPDSRQVGHAYDGRFANLGVENPRQRPGNAINEQPIREPRKIPEGFDPCCSTMNFREGL